MWSVCDCCECGDSVIVGVLSVCAKWVLYVCDCVLWVSDCMLYVCDSGFCMSVTDGAVCL